MNPNNATKTTVSEAEESGYGRWVSTSSYKYIVEVLRD